MSLHVPRIVCRFACPSHCASLCLARSVHASSCPSRAVPVRRRLVGPGSFETIFWPRCPHVVGGCGSNPRKSRQMQNCFGIMFERACSLMERTLRENFGWGSLVSSERRSSKMRIRQRCDENRGAKRIEIRRGQRCEDNRDAKPPS